MDPNPDIHGNRGIIYKQNNKIKIDFYDIFSSDGRKRIITYLVKVENDRLYVLEYLFMDYVFMNQMLCYVYEKKDKVPEGYKNYEADW
jgi:hypothetical protein